MKRDKTRTEIRRFLEGRLSADEACRRLGVHRTTLWRWRRKWERTGSLAHGLAGRRPHNVKAESFRRMVCDLFAASYRPLGHSAHSFYRAVARGLPDYASYKTVLAWLKREGLVGVPPRCISAFRQR